MIVIPAIDIYNDKVVRLYQGDFNTAKIYNESAVNQAKIFADAGFKRIHIVDLSGSREGTVKIAHTIESIKYETNLIIECGGGIRTLENAASMVSAGVNYLIVGSISITDEKVFDEIITSVGAERIILASDVNGDKVAIKGWEETSAVSLDEHITINSAKGIKQFLCTDISRDGALQGTNNVLYERLNKQYSDLSFIASGGVKDESNLIELKNMDMFAAIVGKAYYEDKISLEAMKKYDS